MAYYKRCPIVAPIVAAQGIDPVLVFGVFVVVMCELSFGHAPRSGMEPICSCREFRPLPGSNTVTSLWAVPGHFGGGPSLGVMP